MPTQLSGNKVFASVKGFKRVNEFQSPEALTDSELTVLENAVLDRSGGDVSARYGINSYNTHNANTSTNTYGIISLQEAIVNSLEYIVALIGTELKSFLHGASAWVTQKTGLTLNKVIRLAQYTDKLYLTNGVDAPFIVDLKTSAQSPTFITIAKPDISATTFTPSGSGSILSYQGEFDASFGKFPENGMITAVAINAGGLGYAIGNILTISGGGGNAKLKVDSVGAGGVVTGISIYALGSGYSVSTAQATTGGGNNACTINITAIVIGSGASGAINANDSWKITVAGKITDNSGVITTLAIGSKIKALTNVPGQSSVNWSKMGMESGGRIYALVYVDPSGNSSHSSNSVYVATLGSTNSVTIANIPVLYPRIDLYRTKANDSTLYLLKSLTKNDTTYIDVSSDTDLILETPLLESSPPVQAQQILVKNDSLMLANLGTQEAGNFTDPINGSGMEVHTIVDNATGLTINTTYKYARTYVFDDKTESAIANPFLTLSTPASGTAAKVSIDMWFPVVGSNNGIAGKNFNSMFSINSGNGLLKSIDGGISWFLVGGFSTSTLITGLLSIGTAIFVSTSIGIYTSTDDGKTFTAINSGLSSTNVGSMYYDGTLLYVAVNSNVVYTSSNLGVSWSYHSTLSLLTAVYGFSVIGAFIFAWGYTSLIGATHETYLYMGSGVWSGTNLTGLLVTSLIVHNGNLYATQYGGGVSFSTDHGSTWTAINTGLSNVYAKTIYSDGFNLYVGLVGINIFKSTNNGSSWSFISSGITSSEIAKSIFKVGTRLYVGAKDSLFFPKTFYSDNEGVTWFRCEDINTDAGILDTRAFAKPTNQFLQDYFITGSYYNSAITAVKIWRTKGGGTTYYLDKTILAADWNDAMLNGFSDIVPDTDLGTTNYPVYVDPSSTITNYPSRIVWSENARLQTFLALSFIEVGADDGDVINGWADDRNGILIYKTNSIWKLFTSGDSSNWSLQKLVSDKGCSDPNSFVVTPKGNIFAHNGTICLHQGDSGEAVVISTLYRETIKKITSFMQATYNSINEWVIFPVNISTLNYLIIYDLKLDTWYKFSIPFTPTISNWSALSKKLGTDADKILVSGDIGGLIGTYDPTLNTGSDIYPNATAFNVHARTKTFDFPDGVEFIRPRKIWINESVKAGESIVHTLGNPDSGVTISYIETGTPTGIDTKQIVTDAMVTSSGFKLTSLTKFYYDIAGTLLDKFLGIKFEGTILNRGRRG